MPSLKVWKNAKSKEEADEAARNEDDDDDMEVVVNIDEDEDGESGKAAPAREWWPIIRPARRPAGRRPSR